MANWHILDGNIYVSKSGNDNTGDGSQSLPYASINKALTVASNNVKVVVGTGSYNESLTHFLTGLNLVGDGCVVLDGSSPTPLISGFFHSGNLSSVENFTFQNFSIAMVNAFGVSFNNCIFKNGYCIIYPNSVLHNCLFINCSTAGGSLGASEIKNNTFIDSDCSFYNLVVNQCVDNIFSNSTIEVVGTDGLTNFFTSPSKRFDYNIIYNPPISNYFDGHDLEYWKNLYPTKLANTFTANPQFNQVTADDLTLSASSTLIFAGSDGGHIGAFGPAKSYDGLISELTVGGGAVYNNVTLDGSGNFTLTTPGTGTIESANIDLGFLQDLGKISFFGDQNVNNDTFDYNTGDTKPNRLTFRMKYAATSGALGSASYKIFEWNTVPVVDVSVNGNGDPSFDSTTAVNINARWVKVEITLRDNGTES